jgi:hypothetical protein
MARAKPAALHPFDAFFTTWREFRKAQVRAVLEGRHSLVKARQEVLASRASNIERLLGQLDGSNGQQGSGGTGNGGTTDGGGGGVHPSPLDDEFEETD